MSVQKVFVKNNSARISPHEALKSPSNLSKIKGSLFSILTHWMKSSTLTVNSQKVTDLFQIYSSIFYKSLQEVLIFTEKSLILPR